MRLLSALVLLCSLCVPAAHGEQWQQIRNANYEVVGFLDPRSTGEIFVRDCRGSITGYVNSQGTFRQGGQKVASGQVPTALLGSTRGCPGFQTEQRPRGW